jgi:hypothetical protein
VNCVKDAHEHHNLRMHTHRTRHKQKKTARRGVFSNKKHPKHTNAICSSCILIATWSWLRVERRDMKECEPRWLVLESRRKPFGVEQTYPAKKKARLFQGKNAQEKNTHSKDSQRRHHCRLVLVAAKFIAPREIHSSLSLSSWGNINSPDFAPLRKPRIRCIPSTAHVLILTGAHLHRPPTLSSSSIFGSPPSVLFPHGTFGSVLHLPPKEPLACLRDIKQTRSA